MLLDLEENASLNIWLWPYRTVLGNRATFDKGTYFSENLPWWKWHQIAVERLHTPLTITYAFVATHNHFVLDRGGSVFNRHAPIIKLPADATEDDHLALLGLLNSSTACFWMKQVMTCKGLGGQGGGIKPEHWSRQYEFAGTMLEKCPLPPDSNSLIELARTIERYATGCKSLEPNAIIEATVDGLAHRLVSARKAYELAHLRMVAYQEELDWKVYSLFGLCDTTATPSPCLEEGLHPEDRPIERLLKQRMAGGESSIFYDVHAYRGTGKRDKPPSDAIEKTIRQRLLIIEKTPKIRLIEIAEFKRRWQIEPWEKQEQRALKNWLLGRLETSKYCKGTEDNPELTTTAQMADVASADADFLQVAALYRGRPDFDLAALVAELVEGEAVPFLPILRYKPTGLRKREIWKRTWELQRKTDDYQRQRVEADAIIAKAHVRLMELLKPSRDQLARIDEKLHEMRAVFGRKWLSQKKSTALESPEETARRLITDLPPQMLPLLEQLEAIACTHHSTKRDYEQARGKLFDDDPEYQFGVKWRLSIPDDPEISVPPKYTAADLLKADVWRLRGKLDVSKERWISYPHCSTESDPTLVVGWAGWNHLEQATALAAYYDARKRERWTAERLRPLLAGLDQLIPWIHQWHSEIDLEYGETAGQSFQHLLESDAHELGLTMADVRNWTPPVKPTKAIRKKAKG